ncbi:hypothetical protein H5410_059020, partial [Solanum commersonii]
YFSTGLKREKIQLADVSDFDNVIPLRSPLNVGLPDYFYCRIIGICNGVLCMLDDLLEYRSRVDFDGSIPDICVIEYFMTHVEICGKVHWTAYKRNGERRVENLVVMFVLGFGFAIKTRDYKVVRMAYAHGDVNTCCHLGLRFMHLVQESRRILMVLFQIFVSQSISGHMLKFVEKSIELHTRGMGREGWRT